MKQMIAYFVLFLMLVGWASGCGQIHQLSVKIGLAEEDEPVVLTVSPDDQEEITAVKALEVARSDYEYALRMLNDKAEQSGDIRKQVWTDRELKNLAGAQDFQVTGIGQVVAPDAKAMVEANEAFLVERVVTTRRSYLTAVDDLLAFYQMRENSDKAQLIETIVSRFSHVRTYLYFLSAEIPHENLLAEEEIEEADELFAKALDLYKTSRSFLNVIRDRGDEEALAALEEFRKLIRIYPRSTKIGRSAYHIAEIYRRYDETARAAVWYDRAWQWDPKLPDPARYRAATLYDYKMRNYDKALVYYHMSLEYEADNSNNASSARVRIRQLEPR